MVKHAGLCFRFSWRVLQGAPKKITCLSVVTRKKKRQAVIFFCVAHVQRNKM